MSVLLLIKTPPPITGATLMNKRVLESMLLRENFNIRSICISYSLSVADLGKFRISKLFKILRVSITLFVELLFHRPQFVYFQISPLRKAFYRDLIFVLIIKLLNVKIVYHLRGKGINEETKVIWKKWLYKFAFFGEEVICLSNLLTYDVKNVFDGQVFVVNNGVPETNYICQEQSNNSHHEPINLLFLSNLIISKGILDFLDALEILLKRRVNFKGIVVGAEGDLDIELLMAEIENRGLNQHVIYLGALYNDDRDEILCTCDILVFPTKNDIWGNVIVEAMQFGKPVVSTIEGAIPEIIDDGVTGFIVEKANPVQLANRIEVLIENHALRHSMGKAGRLKYEKKFTIKHFEHSLKNVFDNVLLGL